MKNRNIYTEEQIIFLRDNCLNYNRKEITELFNKTFNTDVSKDAIQTYCARHGWQSSETQKFVNKFRYTKEQKQFLKENSSVLSRKELVNQFNEKFNLNFTKYQIERYCNKHRWLRKQEPLHKYTKEQKTFLEQNYKNYNRKDLTKKFNETFDTNLEESKITSFCLKRGWKAPDDGTFKNGRVSWCKGLSGKEFEKHYSKESLEKIKQRYLTCKRKYKVGDVFYSSSKGAKVIVVSDERNVKFEKRTMFYSRYMYEKYHNIKLEETDRIIFLDGNKDNFAKENLMCVNQKVLCGINAMYAYGKGKITEAMAEIYKTQLDLNNFLK